MNSDRSAHKEKGTPPPDRGVPVLGYLTAREGSARSPTFYKDIPETVQGALDLSLKLQQLKLRLQEWIPSATYNRRAHAWLRHPRAG
jgi:hypothetical protein